MPEINSPRLNSSDSADRADNLKIEFGTHGRSLNRDTSGSHGRYTVKNGDNLWSVAREILAHDGKRATNREIANFVKMTVADNQIQDANKIKSSMQIEFALPDFRIDESRTAIRPKTPEKSTDSPLVSNPEGAAVPPPQVKVTEPLRAPMTRAAADEVAPATPPSVPDRTRSKSSLSPKLSSGNSDRSVTRYTASATATAVTEGLAADAKLLHGVTVGDLPILGPTPALTPGVMGLKLWQDATKHIPVVGGLMQLPDITNRERDDNFLKGQIIAAKRADPVAARTAIDSHASDLKSSLASGTSTFLAGPGGLLGAELTLKAAASAGVRFPNVWVKGASLVGLAIAEALLINETSQATSHYAFGTKMDSQGKIASETIASVASFAALRKFSVPSATSSSFKLGGVMSTGFGKTALRGAIGFAPGATYGLATHGPWDINPVTHKAYTAGETLKAASQDGLITGATAAAAPYAVEFGVNTSRTLWSSRQLVGAAAASNALYDAGSANPTQINPETGKPYTIAETAVAGGKNLATGAVGGYVVGKFLPAAIGVSTYIPKKLGDIAKFAANESAGTIDSEAATQAAKKLPAFVERAKSAVKPVQDGVNSARRYLGRQQSRASEALIGDNTLLGKKVLPHFGKAKAIVSDISNHAPRIATQATSAIGVPASELYHWNKYDKESEQ